MIEFDFINHTRIFQNLGVISKSNVYPLKSVCFLNAEKYVWRFLLGLTLDLSRYLR